MNNKTSDFFAYSVSLNGRFLFRTEQRMGFDYPDNWESMLAAKFPAAEGFKIQRERHPNGFTTFDLNN